MSSSFFPNECNLDGGANHHWQQQHNGGQHLVFNELLLCARHCAKYFAWNFFFRFYKQVYDTGSLNNPKITK